MESGSRESIQARARNIGAIVQTSVAGNTDYLVCGERVGQAKLEKAKKAGVKVITEAEYNQLFGK
jgi:DNA ligase (NAD+)